MNCSKMFWQENLMTSSPINTLLENENVTLLELLNEEDILQECKSLNKQLVEFLVRPNTIYELIQLIVEEPPNNTDLRKQYKNSAMACEIVASRLPILSENIASDHKLLGKLYSFLDAKPPLNPLLASFFAKTIEVLFTHSTAHQDWYTYQFMCLQVIEYFKSCPDFLQKFLDHLGTSGIMNSLQYITQDTADELKNSILEWLDSQNLVEKLIDLICGTYTTSKYSLDVSSNTSIQAVESDSVSENKTNPEAAESEKETNPVAAESSKEEVVSEETKHATSDTTKESDQPPLQVEPNDSVGNVTNGPVEDVSLTQTGDTSIEPSQIQTSDSIKHNRRLIISRSKNAAQLFCNFISKGREPNNDLSHKSYNPLLAKCLSAEIINHLLESIFTSPEDTRRYAIVNGIQVLLTLLNDVSGQSQPPIVEQVEIHRIAEVIAPWIAKFVQVMKEPPLQTEVPNDIMSKAVGMARLSLANLFVVLVETDSPAVSSAMIENGVFNLLLDMFFEYEFNNLLHASVESIIEKAFNAPSQREVYSNHILVDCKLIERIYNAWENVDTQKGPRPGYMGHMIHIAIHLEGYFSDGSLHSDIWLQLHPKVQEVAAIYCNTLGGRPPTNDSCGMQPLQQEAYNAESMPDINFNEGDDGLSDPMTDLPQMSEQIFNNMCGNNGSSMGDNIMADDWTQANIKNITGDGPLDDAIGKNVSKSSLDGLEDSTYFDLLNNIEGENIADFNKWLISKRMNCPEWIDDGDNDSFSVPLPSIADNGLSPWGDVTDLSNEQSGWADFGSLPETAGISIIPNTFTCEAFAAFDQKNTPTIGTNIMFGNIIPDENLNDEILCDKEIHNDPDAIRIEQIQSDTTISGNIVIDTPYSANQNSDVDLQSGAQKLIANQQNPQEDSLAKESTLPTLIKSPNTEIVENIESPSVLETLTELISNVCLDNETVSCVIPQNEASNEIVPTSDDITAHTESKSDVIPTIQEKDDIDNLNVDGKR